MPDESPTWLRHFFYLALLTAFIQLLQTTAGVVLWARTASPVLLAFGLDAFVGAARELLLARRIARQETALPGAARRALDLEPHLDRLPLGAVAVGYLTVGLLALTLGGIQLWQGTRPAPTLLGVGLAAVSMLLIPIVGSYMKALAVELGSAALKSAAVFTFGNSYLSMVLLIGLLVNAGMERWWGDALGAMVMSPFIIQKGIQILTETRPPEFEEG